MLVIACGLSALVGVAATGVPPAAVGATDTSVDTTDTLASDQFQRRISPGWGKPAEDGEYVLRGKSASFAVDGTAGRVTLGSSNRASLALYPNLSERDVDVLLRFSITRASSSGDYWVWAVARRTLD